MTMATIELTPAPEGLAESRQVLPGRPRSLSRNQGDEHTVHLADARATQEKEAAAP